MSKNIQVKNQQKPCLNVDPAVIFRSTLKEMTRFGEGVSRKTVPKSLDCYKQRFLWSELAQINTGWVSNHEKKDCHLERQGYQEKCMSFMGFSVGNMSLQVPPGFHPGPTKETTKETTKFPSILLKKTSFHEQIKSTMTCSNDFKKKPLSNRTHW